MNRLAAYLADRYRVEGELGRGGMALVYRAHDLRHDRPVALLREQAGLELQAGNAASAVRALRRYVALRGNCEPGLRPELNRARTQLAAAYAHP